MRPAIARLVAAGLIAAVILLALLFAVVQNRDAADLDVGGIENVVKHGAAPRA
jgi:hypothetical protein